MIAGIVGLGLIGGSLAKAYKAAGWTVYVTNRTRTTADYAILSGTADGILDETTLPQCDIVHVSLYPDASIEYLKQNAPYFSKTGIVTDACGTKRKICEAGFQLAEQYGFIFIGGHPMAGTHFSGYKYSRATMFNGASMILVPPIFDDICLLDRMKNLLTPLGLKKIAVTTAENHDRMIAYTSQLAHVVSNAYIKSPSAQQHKGYSAGSFRDLTRVAWLNEKMWTELFLENGDYLANEIDLIADNLKAYSEAIRQNDAPRLEALLREGRIAKELSDS